MGKQKCLRRKPHKQNPTGLLSVKDFEDGEDLTDENKTKAIQAVLEAVQSSNIEEKLSGFLTLESMSYNAVMAVDLSKNSIAKIIGPHLMDPNVSIRAAAASALRHIADNGGQEACTVLLKDDIMTPLLMLFKEYYADYDPKPKRKERGRIDDAKETLVEVITLLRTLCENNDNVINHANQEGVIEILIKFLDITIYGTDLAVVAAQCIFSLSEDNPAAMKVLKRSEETFLNLMNLESKDEKNTSDILLLKVLIAGVMMTIISIAENNVDVIIRKVLNILSETLDVDYKPLLQDLVVFVPPGKKEFLNTAKKRIQDIRQILGTQQQAVEIFANLCYGSEEISEDSDTENSDFEYECESIQDDPMGDKPLKCTSTLSLELVEMIGHLNLTDKVWSKTAPLKDPIRATLAQNIEGKHILMQVRTLRCRAYLCLNNVISAFEISALGGVDNLYRQWVEIGTVIFKDTNPNDIELLESASAAMRATLEKLTEVQTNVFQEMTLNDIQPILNGEKQCPNANVRANLIRILGNLALLFIKDGSLSKQELVKHITTFLLASCSAEAEVWIIAEALDVIMDIYAEDESDQIALDLQLTTKLRALISPFKEKFRQQKKRLGSNALIVSTVNSNINRFIKYKEKSINSN